MEETVLKAQARQVVGKQVKVLRRQGRLPAVLYGHTLPAPILVTLEMREASRMLPSISASHLVTVEVDGERYPALVRERQRHPVLGSLLHLDFQVVSMTETIRTTVYIVLEGEAPAVKNYDGIVVAALEQLDIEALPGDLPERITVDISHLEEIGDSVHVRDITPPAGVTILTDPDEIVTVITAPVAEVEEEIKEVEAEPEVIEKGKKEEDEDF